MRLPINDLLMAVVICGNRATHMCPSAMRLQAASAFIACDSATYVYFVKHSVFSFVHTLFIETLAKPHAPNLVVVCLTRFICGSFTFIDSIIHMQFIVIPFVHSLTSFNHFNFSSFIPFNNTHSLIRVCF
jgi:hypothetical protein